MDEDPLGSLDRLVPRHPGGVRDRPQHRDHRGRHASWNSLSAATRQGYLADPTGFLAAALNLAQIPVCVLGAMVIASEYSTGMIRASVLAVPRRTPMLAAKAAVFAAVAFAVGELVAFASFLIAQAIIRSHIPVSLSDPAVLRAVLGMGLYLTVLGLLGLAIGALVRHTAAALTVVVGVVVVLSNLARTLPGAVGQHIAAYLPTNAGLLITHAHQEPADLLTPWQGFGVLCLWTALLLGAAAVPPATWPYRVGPVRAHRHGRLAGTCLPGPEAACLGAQRLRRGVLLVGRAGLPDLSALVADLPPGRRPRQRRDPARTQSPTRVRSATSMS